MHVIYLLAWQTVSNKYITITSHIDCMVFRSLALKLLFFFFFCRKKKGQQPTGILIHKAKAIGFASVHELLFKQGPDVLNAPNGLRNSKTGLPEKVRHHPLIWMLLFI